eukprot:Rmarinus@m.8051
MTEASKPSAPVKRKITVRNEVHYGDYVSLYIPESGCFVARDDSRRTLDNNATLTGLASNQDAPNIANFDHTCVFQLCPPSSYDIGKPITYGSSVQLLHAPSKRVVTVDSFANSEVDYDAVQVSLQPLTARAAAVLRLFRIMPRFRSKKEGQRVFFEDRIVLQMDQAAYSLHITTIDGMLVREVNCKRVASSIRILEFAPYQKAASHYVRIGDLVQFLHEESSGFVTCDFGFEKGDDDALVSTLYLKSGAEDSQGIGNTSMDTTMSPKLKSIAEVPTGGNGSSTMTSDRVFVEPRLDPRRRTQPGSSTYWSLEFEKTNIGGFVEWERKLRIKHYSSGRYLIVEPCPSYRGPAGETISGTVGITTNRTHPNTLFTLKPVDEADFVLRRGCLARIVHHSGLHLHFLYSEEPGSPTRRKGRRKSEMGLLSLDSSMSLASIPAHVKHGIGVGGSVLSPVGKKPGDLEGDPMAAGVSVPPLKLPDPKHESMRSNVNKETTNPAFGDESIEFQSAAHLGGHTQNGGKELKNLCATWEVHDEDDFAVLIVGSDIVENLCPVIDWRNCIVDLVHQISKSHDEGNSIVPDLPVPEFLLVHRCFLNALRYCCRQSDDIPPDTVRLADLELSADSPVTEPVFDWGSITPIPDRQNLLLHQKFVDVCMLLNRTVMRCPALMKDPEFLGTVHLPQASPLSRLARGPDSSRPQPVASESPLYSRVRVLCVMSYALLRVMCTNNVPCGRAVYHHFPFLTKQLGCKLKVAHLLQAMLRNNESVLRRISKSPVIPFFFRLIQKVGHQPRYLEFLSGLCVCNGQAFSANQDSLTATLFGEFSNVLYGLRLNGGTHVVDVQVEGTWLPLDKFLTDNPLEVASSITKLGDLASRDPARARQQVMKFRDYLAAQLRLYSVLTFQRHNESRKEIQNRGITPDMLLVVMQHPRVPYRIKTLMVDLFVNVFIDRAKIVDSSSRLIRYWDELETTPSCEALESKSWLKVLQGYIYEQTRLMASSLKAAPSSHKRGSKDGGKEGSPLNLPLWKIEGADGNAGDHREAHAEVSGHTSEQYAYFKSVLSLTCILVSLNIYNEAEERRDLITCIVDLFKETRARCESDYTEANNYVVELKTETCRILDQLLNQRVNDTVAAALSTYKEHFQQSRVNEHDTVDHRIAVARAGLYSREWPVIVESNVLDVLRHCLCDLTLYDNTVLRGLALRLMMRLDRCLQEAMQLLRSVVVLTTPEERDEFRSLQDDTEAFRKVVKSESRFMENAGKVCKILRKWTTLLEEPETMRRRQIMLQVLNVHQIVARVFEYAIPSDTSTAIYTALQCMFLFFAAFVKECPENQDLVLEHQKHFIRYLGRGLHVSTMLTNLFHNNRHACETVSTELVECVLFLIYGEQKHSSRYADLLRQLVRCEDYSIKHNQNTVLSAIGEHIEYILPPETVVNQASHRSVGHRLVKCAASGENKSNAEYCMSLLELLGDCGEGQHEQTETKLRRLVKAPTLLNFALDVTVRIRVRTSSLRLLCAAYLNTEEDPLQAKRRLQGNDLLLLRRLFAQFEQILRAAVDSRQWHNIANFTPRYNSEGKLEVASILRGESLDALSGTEGSEGEVLPGTIRGENNTGPTKKKKKKKKKKSEIPEEDMKELMRFVYEGVLPIISVVLQRFVDANDETNMHLEEVVPFLQSMIPLLYDLRPPPDNRMWSDQLVQCIRSLELSGYAPEDPPMSSTDIDRFYEKSRRGNELEMEGPIKGNSEVLENFVDYYWFLMEEVMDDVDENEVLSGYFRKLMGTMLKPAPKDSSEDDESADFLTEIVSYRNGCFALGGRLKAYLKRMVGLAGEENEEDNREVEAVSARDWVKENQHKQKPRGVWSTVSMTWHGSGARKHSHSKQVKFVFKHNLLQDRNFAMKVFYMLLRHLMVIVSRPWAEVSSDERLLLLVYIDVLHDMLPERLSEEVLDEMLPPEIEAYRAQLQRAQTMLAGLGAVQLIPPLLNVNDEIVRKAVLDFTIRLLEEGNRKVQDMFQHTLLDHTDEYDFLLHVRSIFRTFLLEVKARDVTQLEFVTSLLRFLQLLCEGHNLNMQHRLRDQQSAREPVNMVLEISRLLVGFRDDVLDTLRLCTSSVIDLLTADIGLLCQINETLTELCQGPCRENQQTLVVAGVCKGIDQVLTSLMDASKRSLDSAGEIGQAQNAPEGTADRLLHVVDVVANAEAAILRMMTSLLEGNTDRKLIERLARSIDISSLIKLLEFHYNRDVMRLHDLMKTQLMQRKKSRKFSFRKEWKRMKKILRGLEKERTELCTSYYNIIQIFAEYDPSGQIRGKVKGWARSERGHQITEQMEDYVCVVEIIRQNRLERVYFPKPEMCRVQMKRALVQEEKEKFLYKLKRGDASEKVGDLFAKMDDFILIINHQHYLMKLRESPFYSPRRYLYYLNEANYYVRIKTIFCALLLNTCVIGWDADPTYDVIGDNENKHMFMVVVGLLHIVLSALRVLSFLTSWSGIVILRGWREHKDTFLFKTILNLQNGAAPTRAFDYLVAGAYSLCVNTSFLHEVSYLALAILGFAHTNLWYSVCTLDMLGRFRLLQCAMASVTKNVASLSQTMLMGFVVIYIYSIIGWVFFYEESYEFENGPYPTSLLTWVRSHWNYGLRVAPVRGQPDDWGFFFFSMTYFIAVVLILGAIISGIIIDTFGELRDEKKATELDMNEICTVCGLDREQFNQKGSGWKHHIKKEHNMWNYMFLRIHLMNTPVDSLNGQESFLYDMFKNHDISFFPIQRSLCFESIELFDSDDEDFDEVCTKLDTLQATISDESNERKAAMESLAKQVRDDIKGLRDDFKAMMHVVGRGGGKRSRSAVAARSVETRESTPGSTKPTPQSLRKAAETKERVGRREERRRAHERTESTVSAAEGDTDRSVGSGQDGGADAGQGSSSHAPPSETRMRGGSSSLSLQAPVDGRRRLPGLEPLRGSGGSGVSGSESAVRGSSSSMRDSTEGAADATSTPPSAFETAVPDQVAGLPPSLPSLPEGVLETGGGSGGGVDG